MLKEELFWINSSEMDFVTAIEADYKIPIAFKNLEALNRWIDQETELKRISLGQRDIEADVLLLSGLLKPWPLEKADTGQGIFYRQVWARVDYNGYRDAIKFAIKQSEGSRKCVHLYDGDHAVSRARLQAWWPQAWVNIVLVERGVNRAVGSMLEREPLKIPEQFDRITINAESILKTFCERSDQPMVRSQVREYLHEARRRFMIFKNRSRAPLLTEEVEISTALSEFSMSENAWSFFDEFASNLGVEPLDRPGMSMLEFE